jgi:type II secretory pathway component PulJ
MTIAVAIAALLVGAIYQALVSSQRTAEAQGTDSGKEAARTRAVELLKADLRARLKLKIAPGKEESIEILLSTTSDTLAVGEMKRALEEVRYTASAAGLRREEGKNGSVELSTGAVAFQFWEQGTWRKETSGAPPAIRVTFADPDEVVVIR